MAKINSADNGKSSGQVRLVDIIDDMCAGKDVFFRLVRVAEDIMTTDVKTLTLDDTVEGCLRCMENNKLRHVPIVDVPADEEDKPGKPYFMGIISERDIFRLISPYLGKAGEEDTDSSALRSPVAQFVTRNPTSASPETPIPEMIQSMIDSHIDMLPILDKEDLVGVATARDITGLYMKLDAMRRLRSEGVKEIRLVDLANGTPGTSAALLASVLRTVRDVMTEQVVSLEVHQSLSDAMELMQRGKFRHVPVVKSGKLMGIVSDRDILQHLPFTALSQRPEERFRDHLFESDPKDASLRLPVTRIMTQEVVHVSPDCDIYEGARMMYDLGVSCLPVVDEEKKLQGLITVTDLMRALLAAYKLTERAA